MSAPPWVLAIDFGTSSCVVAARTGEGRPEVLDIAGDRRTPSVVVVDEGGAILVGRVAADLAVAHPDRALRAPKSHLGEPHPVVLGGRPWEVTALVAALLRTLASEAIAQMGSSPADVRLTHPATWKRARLDQLRLAAAQADLPGPWLVAEPAAAAVAYADAAGVDPGTLVAVYDLGAGTFDTTVLRAGGGRTFEVIGRPGGDPELGGDLFDELLYETVVGRLEPEESNLLRLDRDPLWRQAAARLRAETSHAKEALSSHPSTDLMVATPVGLRHLRLERGELEDLMRPYIEDSVAILQQAVADAGVDPDQLAAIYLAGGASRAPLVEQLVRAGFDGVTVSRSGDPKSSVAVGATLMARTLGTAERAAPPPVAPTGALTVADPVLGAAGFVGAARSTVGAGERGDAKRRARPTRRRVIAAGAAAAVATAVVTTLVLVLSSSPRHPAPGTAASGSASSTATANPSDAPGGSVPTDAGTIPAVSRTEPPTTADPSTTVPTSTTTVAAAEPTQDQLQQALLTPSQLGSRAVSQAGGELCGDYPQPRRYAIAAYELTSSSGRPSGVLDSITGNYPDAAAAAAALDRIPSTLAGCVTGVAEAITLGRIGSGDFCDQTYEGRFDGTNLQGQPLVVLLGLVRCGPDLAAVELDTLDTAASDGAFNTILGGAAANLGAISR